MGGNENTQIWRETRLIWDYLQLIHLPTCEGAQEVAADLAHVRSKGAAVTDGE